jgi:hypothetical protein
MMNDAIFYDNYYLCYYSLLFASVCIKINNHFVDKDLLTIRFSKVTDVAFRACAFCVGQNYNERLHFIILKDFERQDFKLRHTGNVIL